MRLRYLPLIAAIVVVLGLIIHRVYWNRLLEQERDAIRALGYPATKSEFADWYPLPEGTPNAVDLHLQAFDAFNNEGINYDLLPTMGFLDWAYGDPLPPDSVAEMERLIGRNAETIRLLLRGADARDAYFSADFSASIFALKIEELDLQLFANYRNAVKLLNDLALLRVHQRDGSELTYIHAAQFALGRALYRHYEAPMGAIVGIPIDGLTMESIAASMSAELFNDEQLAAIDALLRDQSEYRNLNTQSASLASLPLTVSTLFFKDPISSTTYHFEEEDGIEFVGQVVRGSAHEVHEVTQLARWYYETPGMLDVHTPFVDLPPKPVTEKMTDRTDYKVSLTVIEQTRRIRVLFMLYRLAIASERHRLEHGVYPDALGEALQYGEELSTLDPYTGDAYIYESTGDAFSLYSVGPNRKPEGGIDPTSLRRLGDDIGIRIVHGMPLR